MTSRRADGPAANAAFGLSESKSSPPAPVPGSSHGPRWWTGLLAEAPRPCPWSPRPATASRRSWPSGPSGTATPGRMGLGRRARQRPCGPADVHRRRPRSHRAARAGGVPRLAVARRGRHGPHAAGVRDRGHGPAGRPSSSTTSKQITGQQQPRRGRLARPPPPRRVQHRHRLTRPAAPAHGPAARRRAGSRRSARTTWRWTDRGGVAARRPPASRSATATCDELVRRTEGWPVGLYLAALAVRAGGPAGRGGRHADRR